MTNPITALLEGLHRGPRRSCVEDSPDTLSGIAHQIVHFAEDLNALGHVKVSHDLKILGHKLEEAAQAQRLANCMEQALTFAPAGGNNSIAVLSLLALASASGAQGIGATQERRERVLAEVSRLRLRAKEILGQVRESVPEGDKAEKAYRDSKGAE